jgi:micrococcal nuclease
VGALIFVKRVVVPREVLRLMVLAWAVFHPGNSMLVARELQRGTATSDARGLEVTIKQVVDGDTLRVTGIPEGVGLVRLTGIDAPETGDGRTTRECFGSEARQWLRARTPPGTRVRLVTDIGERDRFGRLLAYAYARDGGFLNAELVASGYARTMTIRPNLRHAKELQAAERRAQRGSLGLWGACPDRRRQ